MKKTKMIPGSEVEKVLIPSNRRRASILFVLSGILGVIAVIGLPVVFWCAVLQFAIEPFYAAKIIAEIIAVLSVVCFASGATAVIRRRDVLTLIWLGAVALIVLIYLYYVSLSVFIGNYVIMVLSMSR